MLALSNEEYIQSIREARKDYKEGRIKFLKDKYGNKTERKCLKFDWEGGLSDLKDKYTSVELQHKVLEWR
ncbi:TPA: DUF2281 domain-containing protein [bacterium]|nr:DUF2281 domain-containing protein [bacterium]